MPSLLLRLGTLELLTCDGQTRLTKWVSLIHVKSHANWMAYNLTFAASGGIVTRARAYITYHELDILCNAGLGKIRAYRCASVSKCIWRCADNLRIRTDMRNNLSPGTWAHNPCEG